jgi:hypothetical protein
MSVDKRDGLGGSLAGRKQPSWLTLALSPVSGAFQTPRPFVGALLAGVRGRRDEGSSFSIYDCGRWATGMTAGRFGRAFSGRIV